MAKPYFTLETIKQVRRQLDDARRSLDDVVEIIEAAGLKGAKLTLTQIVSDAADAFKRKDKAVDDARESVVEQLAELEAKKKGEEQGALDAERLKAAKGKKGR